MVSETVCNEEQWTFLDGELTQCTQSVQEALARLASRSPRSIHTGLEADEWLVHLASQANCGLADAAHTKLNASSVAACHHTPASHLEDWEPPLNEGVDGPLGNPYPKTFDGSGVEGPVGSDAADIVRAAHHSWAVASSPGWTDSSTLVYLTFALRSAHLHRPFKTIVHGCSPGCTSAGTTARSFLIILKSAPQMMSLRWSKPRRRSFPIHWRTRCWPIGVSTACRRS